MRAGVQADLDRQNRRAENLRLLREQQELQRRLEDRNGTTIRSN